MRLKVSPENKQLVGIYHNADGWPEISIAVTASHYLFSWGVMSGPVFSVPGKENSYLSLLGPIMRTFRSQKGGAAGDSLFTGSLKYAKTQN